MFVNTGTSESISKGETCFSKCEEYLSEDGKYGIPGVNRNFMEKIPNYPPKDFLIYPLGKKNPSGGYKLHKYGKGLSENFLQFLSITGMSTFNL